MAQVISLNTEVVSAAVSRISVLTADVKSRTDALVAKLEEQNQKTDGKWNLIVSLQKKLEEEQRNVNDIIEAQEAIKRSLDRFAEMAEEANDDSAFSD